MAEMHGPTPRPSQRMRDQFEVQYDQILQIFKDGDVVTARSAALEFVQAIMEQHDAKEPQVTKALVLCLQVCRPFGGSPEFAERLSVAVSWLEKKIAEVAQSEMGFLTLPGLKLLQAEAFHQLARNELDPATVYRNEGVYNFPKAIEFAEKSRAIRAELRAESMLSEGSPADVKPKILAALIAEAQGNKHEAANLVYDFITFVGVDLRITKNPKWILASTFDYLELAECLDILGCQEQFVSGVRPAMGLFMQAKHLREDRLSTSHPLLGYSDHLIGRLYDQMGSSESAINNLKRARAGLSVLFSIDSSPTVKVDLDLLTAELHSLLYRRRSMEHTGGSNPEDLGAPYKQTLKRLEQLQARSESSNLVDPVTLAQIQCVKASIYIRYFEVDQKHRDYARPVLTDTLKEAAKNMNLAMSLSQSGVPHFREGLIAKLAGHCFKGEPIQRSKLASLEKTVEIISKSVSPCSEIVCTTIRLLAKSWDKLAPGGSKAKYWASELAKLPV